MLTQPKLPFIFSSLKEKVTATGEWLDGVACLKPSFEFFNKNVAHLVVGTVNR